MIRAAIFDLGGVLVRLAWHDAVAAQAAALGMETQALLDAMYGGCDDTVLVGRMTEDEWWEVVQRRIGRDASWRAAFERDLDALETQDEEMAAFVATLRPRELRTAYLSNAWGPSTHERIGAMGLDRLVDHVLLSCEIGHAKPSPEAYRAALDRVGVAPGEAIFVDDSPANVEAAATLGIHAILHESAAGTIAAVRTMLGDPVSP